MSLMVEGAWNPEKVRVFKDFYFNMLDKVVIASKDNGLLNLGQNIFTSQKIFYNDLWDGLENDIHWFFCAKARQLGISSATRPLTLGWCGAFEGTQGALVYDTDPHKEEARMELEFIIDHFPKSVKFPRVVKSNRNMIQLSNGSNIRLLSAGVRKTSSGGTLGRSSGIGLLHASELCSFANPEGWQALLASLSEWNTNRLFICESTARGFNQWYEMWEEAKSDPINKKTTFIGWWAKETYSLPVGSRLYEHYASTPISNDEAKRIAQVKELYGWEITMSQLAWFRRKVDPGRTKEADEREDGLITQDFPWTEEEMFQSTGSTFFNAEKLTTFSKNASEYKFKPFKFWPGHTFLDSEIDKVKTYRETDVKIFEEPEPESVYVIAGDPAYGYNDTNDRASCQVLKCYADCAEQVAEASSPNWHPKQFAHLMLTMVGYYGMGGQNEIQFMLELQGGGEATLMEIQTVRKLVTNSYLSDKARESGIQNLFVNFRNYMQKNPTTMSDGHLIGWKTTVANKVPLMERLRDVVHDGTLLVRSYDTLAEMKSVAREGNVIKAEGSKKDDRVVSLALGVRAWEDRIRPKMMAGRRTKVAFDAAKSQSPVARRDLFTQFMVNSITDRKEAERRLQNAQMRKMQYRNSWRNR